MTDLTNSPVAIGGVGGSGTRVVASILQELGFFLGENLNQSLDNQSFPSLRKQVWMSELSGAAKLTKTKALIRAFERKELGSKLWLEDNFLGWGWKAPATFYWQQALSQYFLNFRYIHVIRHGLDMAFSKNQNQTIAWSERFNIDVEGLPLPRAALQYWIAANKLAIADGRRYPSDFLLINFNQLCASPNKIIEELVSFLGIDVESIDIQGLSSLVIPPNTLDRFKKQSLAVFSEKELRAVSDLGFELY